MIAFIPERINKLEEIFKPYLNDDLHGLRPDAPQEAIDAYKKMADWFEKSSDVFFSDKGKQPGEKEGEWIFDMSEFAERWNSLYEEGDVLIPAHKPIK